MLKIIKHEKHRQITKGQLFKTNRRASAAITLSRILHSNSPLLLEACRVFLSGSSPPSPPCLSTQWHTNTNFPYVPNATPETPPTLVQSIYTNTNKKTAQEFEQVQLFQLSSYVPSSLQSTQRRRELGMKCSFYALKTNTFELRTLDCSIKPAGVSDQEVLC